MDTVTLLYILVGLETVGLIGIVWVLVARRRIP